MNNYNTLFDYDIKQESILRCVYKNEDGFQIFIKGLDGKSLTFQIGENDTIENLKEMCYGKTGIYANEQRLIFTGKQLEDKRTVQSYNIQRDQSLHLVLRLRGGLK